MERFSSLLFAAGTGGGQILFIALLLATTASLLFRARKRLGHSNANGPRSSSQGHETRSRRSAGSDSLVDQANRIEVRLHDRLREAQGRLDTKIAALNQLIVDADRESARLEVLMKRFEGGMPLPKETHGAKGSDGGTWENLATDSPIHRRDEAVQSVPSPHHAKIYALSDAGLDAPGIAQRTGSGLGEIELILGLRGKKT